MYGAMLRYGPGVAKYAFRGGKGLLKTWRLAKAGKRAASGAAAAYGAYDTVKNMGMFTPRKSSPQRGESRGRYGQKIAKARIANMKAQGTYNKNKRSYKYKNAKFSQMAGQYGGSFGRASVKGAQARKKFVEKGMTQTTETHGLVDDPDCCYLMHASMAYQPLIRLAAKSIIRKLFVKAQFEPTSSSQIIPLVSITFDSLVMIIYDQNRVAISTTTPPLLTDCTIDYFAGALYSQFLQYSNQPVGANEKRTPTWIYLFQDPSDVSVGTDNYINLSNICLLDERVHIMSKSELKIQNRSNSAAGSTNIDDVSNNPLVGKVYEFNYLPTPYNEGLNVFKSISSTNGVKLVRAAEVALATGGNFFKEPPIPKIFRNCVKATTIRLEPGSIKYHNLIDFVSKNVLLWLEDIAFSNIEDLTRVKCKIGLIALEDVINVNEAQLITLAYECQKSYSVYTETKRKVSILTDFASNEIDNLTP